MSALIKMDQDSKFMLSTSIGKSAWLLYQHDRRKYLAEEALWFRASFSARTDYHCIGDLVRDDLYVTIQHQKFQQLME